jgi:aspartate carbamoyltransferase regulatory subunit
MALILKLLDEAKQNPTKQPVEVEGMAYDLPCRNPKCISQTEQELPHAARQIEGTYRCVYCEQKV